MEFTPGFIAVLIGAAVAFGFLIANIVVISKSGEDSTRLSRAMYITALITIGINIARMVGNPGTGYMIAGNFVALGCVFLSHKRYRVRRWEREMERRKEAAANAQQQIED